MITIRRGHLAAIWILILFLAGVGVGRWWNRPYVKIGERKVTVNVRARIDPKRQYTLRVWDTAPPGMPGYRDYLEKAFAGFQKEHPNIRVELTLLDPEESRRRHQEGLRSGDLPDVYCSAYWIPAFDYGRQIPAGPFLSEAESAAYLPAAAELGKVAGVQCALPRWVAPLVWIGNRKLLDSEGVAVTGLQTNGWTWADVAGIYGKSPGRYGFTALYAESAYPIRLVGSKVGADETLNGLDGLIRAKAIRRDYTGRAVRRFISGEAPLLAGARLWTFAWLREKLKNPAAVDPVLLPCPAIGSLDRTWRPAEAGVIAVYRNRRTQGDDQLAAAARLAYFCSTYGEIGPWRELMVCPAAAEPFNRWRGELEPGGLDLAPLAQWMERGRLINYDRPRTENFRMRLCHQYLTGESSKEEIRAELARLSP
jgi:hypothetical protein